MQGRPFILSLFASALATMAFIIVLPQIPGMKTDPSAPWIDGMYTQKLAALHRLGGKRIYVVSGSSSLFSLDSEVLSQVAGRPVINLATHAGLGLTYILDRAEREIRAGDTIIFTPEYPLLEKPATPSDLTIAYVTFFDRRYIATRPLVEQIQFYLGYGFVDSLVQTLKAIRTGKQVGRDDLTIDALGNARGNTVALSVNDKTEFDTRGDPPPITQSARDVVRKFAAVARERHAVILAFPSALIHMPGWEARSQRTRRGQIRALFADVGMKTRGDDQAGWVEPSGIYDTSAHANDAGRAAYTARIAVLLCQEIRCTNPPQ